MKKLTTLAAGILLGVALTFGYQLATNQAQALRAEGYTQGVEDGEAFADSRWFAAIDYYNEAWYDGDIDPKDPALLIQFESWNQAWKDWSKSHDEWNYMDLARCHGKWIALVKAWEEYYRKGGISTVIDGGDTSMYEFIHPSK